MSRDIWTRRYAKPPRALPVYDGWLDRYEEVLVGAGAVTVLDLGCGRGTDSEVLRGLGCRVVHTDFVEAAVAFVNDRIGERTGIVADHSRAPPFRDGTFHVVVANLTLHYFEDAVTRSIFPEIRRVLRHGGVLLSRFNSVNDRNYGADPAASVQSVRVKGVHKEFFTERRLRDLIGNALTVTRIEEYATSCFGSPKVVVEVCARKSSA